MAEISAATLDEIARGDTGRDGTVVGNDLVEIQPGFYLGRTDMPLDGVVSHAAESFPFAALSILLEGHVSTEVKGLEQLDPNGMLVASHNERRSLVSRFHGSQRLRSVEVIVTPGWFETLATWRDDPVLERLRISMEKPLQHRRLPLGGRVRDIAQSILVPSSGAIAALRLEARALDLLAELADSFRSREPGSALLRRDRDRMYAVRQVIEADPAAVSSLAALAAAHGVSASKLKRDFFLAFSTCVGGFVNEQRLSRGRRLLEEGMSVSQTAYSLGYAHPTNFSAAFKRRYGVSPRSARG